MIRLQDIVEMRSMDAKIFLKNSLDLIEDSKDKQRALKLLREGEFCYTIRKSIVNFINKSKWNPANLIKR